MTRLRGNGLGMGRALGTAAVVTLRQGFPMPPEMPQRIAGQIAAHRLNETPEVILVAGDYNDALALLHAIRWARVVGIVAGTAPPDAPVPPVPAVVNVASLFGTIEDDSLLLVDAERGTVLVDPEPMAIAQYQTIHDNLAPKRRFYLDDVHQTAHTLDGRTILVMVGTDSPSQLAQMLQEGPDALYTTLPTLFDDTAQQEALDQLVDLTAGKPLFLAYNPSLPLQPIVEAAARADITLVVPPTEENDGQGIDTAGVAQLAADLAAVQERCIDEDIACGVPHIGADIVYRITESWPKDPAEIDSKLDTLANSGVTRIIFYGLVVGRELLARFERLVSQAATHLIPVYFYASGLQLLDAERVVLEAEIRHLIGAGVAGFLLPELPGMVATFKEIIRNASDTECREELWRILQEVEESA